MGESKRKIISVALSACRYAGTLPWHPFPCTPPPTPSPGRRRGARSNFQPSPSRRGQGEVNCEMFLRPFIPRNKKNDCKKRRMKKKIYLCLMLKEFKAFIESENLFCRDDKVLLAVSGGIDSVVMAELFHLAGYSFGIAHCIKLLKANEILSG